MSNYIEFDGIQFVGQVDSGSSVAVCRMELIWTRWVAACWSNGVPTFVADLCPFPPPPPPQTCRFDGPNCGHDERFETWTPVGKLAGYVSLFFLIDSIAGISIQIGGNITLAGGGWLLGFSSQSASQIRPSQIGWIWWIKLKWRFEGNGCR